MFFWRFSCPRALALMKIPFFASATGRSASILPTARLKLLFPSFLYWVVDRGVRGRGSDVTFFL